MKTKAKGYSEAIISISLQHGESAMAYNSYYMASISYGTSANSLTIKSVRKYSDQSLTKFSQKWEYTETQRVTWFSGQANMEG
jgi:hypothetical protein